MRREGSGLRTFRIVATVLLVLAVSVGIVSYLYVVGRQDYLSKRNFRLLAVQSTQFKQRIENYSSAVFPHLVKLACSQSPKGTDPCGIEALSGQVQTLEGLYEKHARTGVRSGQGNHARAGGSAGERASTTSSMNRPWFNVEQAARGSAHLEKQVDCSIHKLTSSLTHALAVAPSLKLQGNPTLVFNPMHATLTGLEALQSAGVFQLAFVYEQPLGKKGYGVRFRAVTNMDDLMSRTDGGVFDDVLVVRKEENENVVIYQQSSLGPRLTKLGSVVNEKGDTFQFTNVMSSSGVYSLNLAGTQYKVFVQPIRLPRFEIATESRERKTSQDWSICGLVQAGRFRSESLEVSNTLLLLFLPLLALALSGWPLLKLWSLGRSDQLRRTDVIMVFVSTVLVCGLLTLLFLDLYATYRINGQLDNQLKQFAEEINQRFDHELGQLCGLLYRADTELGKEQLPAKKQHASTVCDDQNNLKTSILCPNDHRCVLPHWLRVNDPYFEMITWVNTLGPKEGCQTGKWTIKGTNTPLINVSNRSYFRKVKEGEGWTKSFGEQPFKFFLEPIISLNTGQTLAELSMPGQPPSEGVPTDHIITIVPQLLSLREAVLPPGFGYAVINDKGTVLFHSDLKRTLSENFFQECDEDSDLRASVYARVSEWVDAPYMGRAHRLYVRPLKDLPWTLVVFRDKGILRTMNLELFSAALILYLIYGMIFLLPLALYCLWKGDWIWPQINKRADYHILLVANLALIALLLTDSFFTYRHHIPYLSLVLPPFALLTSFLALQGTRPATKLWRYALYLLLAALPVMLLVLGLWDTVEAEKEVYFAVTIVQVTVLYVIFAFVLYRKGSFFSKIAEVIDRYVGDRLNFSLASMLVGVSLVVIIGVLSPLALFRASYQTEMEALVKYDQLSLAHSIIERDALLKHEYLKVKKPKHYLDCWLNYQTDSIYSKPFFGPHFDCASRRCPSDETGNIYSKPFFNTRFDCGSSPQASTSRPPPKERTFDKVIKVIQPLYNDVAIQTHELVDDAASDGSYQWKSNEAGQMRLARWPDPAPVLRPITSDLPVLQWPSTFERKLGLAVAVLLFLFGIYSLIRLIGNKIFLLDHPLTSRAGTEEKDLGEVTENTLVLGRTHSVRTPLLNRPDFHVVDIRQIGTAWAWRKVLRENLPSNKRVIAIDHFDCGKDDPGCNFQKLRLLEKYPSAKCPLVVASAMDPMDFCLTMPQEEGHKKEKKNDASASQETKSDPLARLRSIRWAAVWSTFTRRVYAAEGAEGSIQEAPLKDALSHTDLSEEPRKELLNECKPTEPLSRIGIDIADFARGKGLSSEQLIDEVLERAQAYYRVLWTGCANEEKRALLDLADDGFVNAPHRVLQRLVDQGLVKTDPHLQLMNKSFQRFLVGISHTEDVTALREQLWNPKRVIRGTIISVMIVVALVLFVTQPQLMNLSTTFIGTAAVSVPAILKLFDVLRGTQSVK